MARYAFSPRINFGLHIPMVVLNMFVVGALVWDTTPATQNKIFVQNTTTASPVVALVATAIAALYGLTVILLAICNIIVPVLPRLLVDFFILIPSHLISIIILGAWTNWSALRQIADGQVGPAWRSSSDSSGASSDDGSQQHLSSRQLTCTDPSWTTDMCVQQWKSITIIQTICFAFGWVCFALVVVDFILSLRIHLRRRSAVAKGINPDEEDEVMSFAETETESTLTLATQDHHREAQAQTRDLGGPWISVTKTRSYA